jgi:hemolysin activation/secretion protein
LNGWPARAQINDRAQFIDYGRVWVKVNENPGNPISDTTKADYFASAGLGLRWNPLRRLDAQLYWGRAIAKSLHGVSDPLRYVPHDLQYRGLHFAVGYLARW